MISRTGQKLCYSCSNRLLSLFAYGFAAPRSTPLLRGKQRLALNSAPKRRTFAHSVPSRQKDGATSLSPDGAPASAAVTVQRLEDLARLARQTFGDRLPRDFLTQEEYHVYERLYGPPIANGSDDSLGIGDEKLLELDTANTLLREGPDGTLEEVTYEEEQENDTGHLAEGMETDGDLEVLREAEESSGSDRLFESEIEFLHRVEQLRRSELAKSPQGGPQAAANIEKDDSDDAEIESDNVEVEEPEPQDAGTVLAEEEDLDYGSNLRSHPLTTSGRSGTVPSTLSIPKEDVLNPVSDFLADISNRKLAEVAHNSFGGPDLPHSTSTIFKHGTKQQTIGLDAFQHTMKEMEGNAFFAGVMPGAYASISSVLVEIRKRMGSEWLRNLMQQDNGPRILDAGSGGAGVLAWRNIIRAEWEAHDPEASRNHQRPPYGRSTVVTGSPVLRQKASRLLDNTSFIPRLPDYDPARDHPALESNNPQPRKQYDLIIASYSLWQHREDYMRKAQVQNLWSLLEPKGGVLILLEKGIPRGFELIAAARETLLKYHVSSTSEDVEYPLESTSENRFGARDKAMIIAPCTNHGKCPMYVGTGRSQGRKDYCHFEQRFQRPPFLQRLLDKSKVNHEDIKFSYVAFQRGADQRRDGYLRQGKAATDAAFIGYEGIKDDVGVQALNTLSLPRNILPPIKRKGHVTLDLCTPAGRIERWTVPKSFSKQAYRDARKAQWGDLWALGAKTRVLRRIRVGRTSAEGNIVGQDRSANETDEQDPDASAFEAPEKPIVRKKKKARKGHKKLLLEGNRGET